MAEGTNPIRTRADVLAEVLTPERLRTVYGVSVVVERLSQDQTVCAPDYGAGIDGAVRCHENFTGSVPGRPTGGELRSVVLNGTNASLG
jgi:hypothetical protein